MRGRAGPGALIGLAVGVVLVVMVIWVPAALAGDFYEITDPLVYMGLPMIVISVAVGALIGVPAPPAVGNGSTGPERTSVASQQGGRRSARRGGRGPRRVVLPDGHRSALTLTGPASCDGCRAVGSAALNRPRRLARTRARRGA